MEGPSDSKLLYQVDNNSTRLMIGLKWDPRRTNIKDKSASGALSLTAYLISVALWVPSLFVSLLTRKVTAAPSKLSNHILYNAKNIDKKSDDGTTRESNFSQYDLDLYCYAFDDKNDFLFLNGPETENMISGDGVIYSKGEDFTGRGIYDDESAYIDLKKITNQHANFFIVVVSDCKYDFATLDNQPQIRIVDSKLEKNLTSVDIPTDKDLGAGRFVYIYARLSQKDGVWNIHPIQKFAHDPNDILPILKTYLPKSLPKSL